jgi:coronin-1B/1C/6
VGHVLFNPAAENILASSSGDYTIKIWDLEDGKPKLTLKGNDIFTSLSWSANGSTLVTTSRDKKLRFWDVRQERPAYEGQGHGGAKNSRVAWLGEHDRVVTTGFSKMSERQLGLWDFRAPHEPLGGFTPLDSGSGVVMPFWDDGCQMLYLAGKGDGNIRYYEYANDKFEYLSEYRSAQAQRGVAFLPKRGVNTHENEVVRAFKTVDDLYIEPISFVVPRRAETFQEDIYPPTISTKPAMSSAEWFQGKSAVPMKISMADVYDGNAKPSLIAAADVPPPSQHSEPAPSPAKAVSRPSAPAEEPRSAAPPRETPSVNSNKQSMSAAADRFADRSNGAEASRAEDDEEPEEWKQPTRSRQTQIREPEPSSTSASQEKRETPSSSTTSSSTAAAVKPLNLAPTTVTTSANLSSSAEQASSEEKSSSSAAAGSLSSTPSASAAAGGLRDVLHEIRSLLQGQGRQIEELTREVAALKAKVGES